MSTETDNLIIATPVPDNKRLDFMPGLFGRRVMTAEATLYHIMETLCPSYNGAYWEFVTLSNGGCYMYPKLERPMLLYWDGNDFQAETDAEVAGIIATFFTISAFFNSELQERLVEVHYALRDYIFTLEDARKMTILRALD